MKLKRAIAAVVLVSVFAAPVAAVRCGCQRRLTQRPCDLFARWQWWRCRSPIQSRANAFDWPRRAAGRGTDRAHMWFVGGTG